LPEQPDTQVGIQIDIKADIQDSPLQRLQSDFLDNAEVQLYLKRDDLIHPLFGGNKWRKLKYNLIHAREQNIDTLLTFGGAWSNHIHATAAAGKHFGFQTIGIIRGEEHEPLNPTLTFAKSQGMQLHYIDRQQYRHKNDPRFIEELKRRFGNIYILPEGGSNQLAIRGCEEIVPEVNQQLSQQDSTDFDYICCASGTGATLAGLASMIKPGQQATGFSVLKGDFLQHEVRHFMEANETHDMSAISNWHVENRYHFGGYAKASDELINFIRTFKTQYGVELDAVYTGKMFYGLFDMIRSAEFPPGSSIVAIHSGGLQGNKGFNL
jgi:1-aminocyclopropane-1-carboxylate deaminase/D-cysteine desulfhydrase-like pyridoxal-dependent ACC family enzyme